MPFNASSSIFYYNKDAFKEVGLDPDKPPVTFSEITDAAKKLTKKDASGQTVRYGFGPSIYGWFFEQLLATSGALYAAPAQPPSGLVGFHAAWYGQSGYMSLCAGTTATATVAFYNSGSRGWVAGRLGEGAYLGTWNPDPGQDRASYLGGDGTNGSPATGWPRFNRLASQPAAYVGP